MRASRKTAKEATGCRWRQKLGLNDDFGRSDPGRFAEAWTFAPQQGSYIPPLSPWAAQKAGPSTGRERESYDSAHVSIFKLSPSRAFTPNAAEGS